MISIYLNGRLGNQLFQYVFCRIASIKNNCNFYIPANIIESTNFYKSCNNRLSVGLQLPTESNPHYWIGNNLFETDLGYNDNNIKRVVSEIDINHQLYFNNIIDGDLIKSFCQFESNLIEYENVIKNDWFKFKPNLIENCAKILNKYDIDKYCVIHFRGGDYKSIDRFYLPQTYYDQAKLKLPTGLKYLIITDDIEEASKFFPNDEIISNSVEIDFCLISMFKYIIIPNSSFSWWSAWLSKNNPLVIAPDKWFNYNSGGDFFPIGIKTDRFIYI
jgi:hypothetical protein